MHTVLEWVKFMITEAFDTMSTVAATVKVKCSAFISLEKDHQKTKLVFLHFKLQLLVLKCENKRTEIHTHMVSVHVISWLPS